MKPRIFIATLALFVVAGSIVLFQKKLPLENPSTKAGSDHAPAKAQKTNLPRLAPEISRITDSSLHWEERISAVRALPTQLDQASVDFLFAYLSANPDEKAENRYLICNEIMEIFRKRNLSPAHYNRQLCNLIVLPSADPVIRDYAAQHLAQWISGMSPDATEPDPTQIPTAVETLLTEASRSENSQMTLPGTVFQAMADAVLNGSAEMETHRPAIVAQAMRVLSDPSFSNVNRSSAMQAAALLAAPDLREHCLQYAEDTQNAPDLRLSAIAALGKVGHPDDAAVLKILLGDPDYQYAATAALQALSSRPITQ